MADGLDAPAFRFAVRTAGVMLFVSGSFAALWAVAVVGGVPGPDVHWRVVVFTVGVSAVGFGAVLLLLGRRTPKWLLFAFPQVTAGLICLPPLVSHESTPAGSILLVWPVLFAGYLLPERVAWVTLAVSLGLLVAVALRKHTSDAVATSVEVGLSLVATVYITVHLRRNNRALVATLRREARTDPLTGLANRRAFDDLLEREFGLYERHGGPMALLAIDIDHFKRLNDCSGHPAGDAALVALAAVLAAHVRHGDSVARTGGEEFAMLLTDCPAGVAQRRAHALLAVVAAESAAWPDPITISIGVAAIPDHAGAPAELVTAADTALYAAKAAGRNTVAAA
ncbi:GGDEF domain-containing protein [Actinospica durhamensis]|uniref:GGDEF domain-containing protein n=1 Tax=Actinospica durhamensis TaxID=1508375 RepID=UPI0027DC2F8E|nr:GGDEF domain-containing protein [Actinospica durhamensis]